MLRMTTSKPAFCPLSSIASLSRKVCGDRLPPRLLVTSTGSKVVPFRNFSIGKDIRAYPSYTIYGEKCILNLKLQPPNFRISASNVLQMDYTKKGRLLLEWVPRNVDGSVSRNEQLRFSLSPEESGLLIDQIPKSDVELFRLPNTAPGGNLVSGPGKILRVVPGASGQVSFQLEYSTRNTSVGGLSSNDIEEPTQTTPLGPLEVTVQLGEYQVMKQIILSSLPTLVGWTSMMEVALRQSVSDALKSRSYSASEENSTFANSGSQNETWGRSRRDNLF